MPDEGLISNGSLLQELFTNIRNSIRDLNETQKEQSRKIDNIRSELGKKFDDLRTEVLDRVETYITNRAEQCPHNNRMREIEERDAQQEKHINQLFSKQARLNGIGAGILGVVAIASLIVSFLALMK